jgi:hypothetical protein
MRAAAVALVLTTVSIAASAQEAISPIALVGKWKAEARHPSGVIVESAVALNQNMRFSGTSTANGRQLMAFTGTWSVADSTLSWRYETNTASIPSPGFVDEDEILSVTPDKLVLRSKLSGKQHEFVRQR